MGEKDSALKLAERAIMLYSRAGTESVGVRTLFTKRTWRGFRRCSARIAVRYQLSRTYYKRHILGTFTGQRLLHEPFLGSTHSGTLCAAILLSKNSVRKSSREDTNYTNRHE